MKYLMAPIRWQRRETTINGRHQAVFVLQCLAKVEHEMVSKSDPSVVKKEVREEWVDVPVMDESTSHYGGGLVKECLWLKEPEWS